MKRRRSAAICNAPTAATSPRSTPCRSPSSSRAGVWSAAARTIACARSRKRKALTRLCASRSRALRHECLDRHPLLRLLHRRPGFPLMRRPRE
ncbi:hypothetical protein B7L88_gp138 [Rhizobium phage RHEph10]|uniref:hypothetical protein n=1 Tax=Rhizobium phage RHEph10 TaxID=1220717 RepID=UPI0002AB5026|nr:hypothetical protein B7L88_gp138 [Rhizobium phage RHEph10]AGC36150.1 hypothetical protein RHEph10_gp107 [Rhizobium phage RHEph10]